MPHIVVFDPNTNTAQDHYEKFSAKDQRVLDKFERYCLVSAGPARANKSKTNAIRFLSSVEKPLSRINLEHFQLFLRLLRESTFSDYAKNDIKGFVRRFLKWHFKDWSDRFNNFEDLKFDSSPKRKEKIDPKDTLGKEEVRELIKHEKTPFYKAFVSTQYKCALRTKECRTLEKSWIEQESEDVWWLNVPSKKNRLGKVKIETAPPLDREGIELLQMLFRWQETEGIQSKYVFPSPSDPKVPISSGAVSKWFCALTKKVLGKKKKSYILRHSFANVLRRKVMDGQIAKSEAAKLMRHSEKMFDETYYNIPESERRELLKHQLLGIEEPTPEQKHALERKIDLLQKKLEQHDKVLFETEAMFKKITGKKIQSVIKAELEKACKKKLNSKGSGN